MKAHTSTSVFWNLAGSGITLMPFIDILKGVDNWDAIAEVIILM